MKWQHIGNTAKYARQVSLRRAFFTQQSKNHKQNLVIKLNKNKLISSAKTAGKLFKNWTNKTMTITMVATRHTS